MATKKSKVKEEENDVTELCKSMSELFLSAAQLSKSVSKTKKILDKIADIE